LERNEGEVSSVRIKAALMVDTEQQSRDSTTWVTTVRALPSPSSLAEVRAIELSIRYLLFGYHWLGAEHAHIHALR
jgi:hypothetical protein